MLLINTCQAVRTVFNVAINSDSELIKRTAINALLQMLNTVLKRVTQGINYVRCMLVTHAVAPRAHSSPHSFEALHGSHCSRATANSE